MLLLSKSFFCTEVALIYYPLLKVKGHSVSEREVKVYYSFVCTWLTAWSLIGRDHKLFGDETDRIGI